MPRRQSYPPFSLTSCLHEYSARIAHKQSYFENAEGRPLSRLFISNNKPYQPVQSSTLAKWLLLTMDRAGIDTTLYKAHSVRSASAMQMKLVGMSLTHILARAHWSETSRTFAEFYDRS